MFRTSTTVAVLHTHLEAEEAVRELQLSGFDMKELSIIGKDMHTTEHVVGFYDSDDRMRVWGRLDAFWGGLWGILYGSAFFVLPGVGPVLVAGPLVGWIVAGLEGAALAGGLSVLGAAMVSVGVPKDSVLQYESQLGVGKFLLILHGTPDEIGSAMMCLSKAQEAVQAVPTGLVGQRNPFASADSSLSL